MTSSDPSNQHDDEARAQKRRHRSFSITISKQTVGEWGGYPWRQKIEGHPQLILDTLFVSLLFPHPITNQQIEKQKHKIQQKNSELLTLVVVPLSSVGFFFLPFFFLLLYFALHNRRHHVLHHTTTNLYYKYRYSISNDEY